MEKSREQSILDRAEWDFQSNLSGPHLTACCLYEYARESQELAITAAEIKELRKKRWNELCQLPAIPRLLWKGKRLTYLEFMTTAKRAQVRAFAAGCSKKDWMAYERFKKRQAAYEELEKRRDKWPLFHDAALDVIRRHGITSEHYQSMLEVVLMQPFFPETPWQRLDLHQQETIVKYPVTCQPLSPGTLRDFNAVRDALPHVMKEQTPKVGTPAEMMWPDFSCWPYVIRNGRETRPFTIDWTGSADSEICQFFEAWVERRRSEIGIPPPSCRQTRRYVIPSGRGGDKDLRARLAHLGIMRVLNVSRIENVCRSYHAAWRQWVWSETAGKKLEVMRESYLKRPDLFLGTTPDEKGKYTMTFRRILIERRRGTVKNEFQALFPFERNPPRRWVMAQ